jgi:hypothetical protein
MKRLGHLWVIGKNPGMGPRQPVHDCSKSPGKKTWGRAGGKVVHAASISERTFGGARGQQQASKQA